MKFVQVIPFLLLSLDAFSGPQILPGHYMSSNRTYPDFQVSTDAEGYRISGYAYYSAGLIPYWVRVKFVATQNGGDYFAGTGQMSVGYDIRGRGHRDCGYDISFTVASANGSLAVGDTSPTSIPDFDGLNMTCGIADGYERTANPYPYRLKN